MAEALALYLDEIDHLFNAPPFDLHSAHPRSISGIDSIIQHLQPSTRRQEKFTVIIYLPAEQIAPELTEQVRGAMQQFTAQKIDAMEHELAVLRVGLGILALFLALAALVTRANSLPFWLTNLTSQALTIIGSVSLWHPAEAILFDWVPLARQKRIYQFIATLDFEVKAG
jgi:hypothetical protein